MWKQVSQLHTLQCFLHFLLSDSNFTDQTPEVHKSLVVAENWLFWMLCWYCRGWQSGILYSGSTFLRNLLKHIFRGFCGNLVSILSIISFQCIPITQSLSQMASIIFTIPHVLLVYETKTIPQQNPNISGKVMAKYCTILLKGLSRGTVAYNWRQDLCQCSCSTMRNRAVPKPTSLNPDTAGKCWHLHHKRLNKWPQYVYHRETD